MSLFRPKHRDYISRGLTLLIAWWILGMPVLVVTFALVSGNGNVGFLGIPLTLVTGLVGYWQYLKFGEREHVRENARKFELMVELSRLELEILRRRSRTE